MGGPPPYRPRISWPLGVVGWNGLPSILTKLDPINRGLPLGRIPFGRPTPRQEPKAPIVSVVGAINYWFQDIDNFFFYSMAYLLDVCDLIKV